LEIHDLCITYSHLVCFKAIILKGKGDNIIVEKRTSLRRLEGENCMYARFETAFSSPWIAITPDSDKGLRLDKEWKEDDDFSLILTKRQWLTRL
jgi:hypothetical protein